MLRLLMGLLCLSLFGGCCGPYYEDFFPYHDDGTRKPHVALLPVQNGTGQLLPWDLAEELTHYARYETMNNGMLFVYPLNKVEEILDTCSGVDFFTPDLGFARLFPGADYLVVAEMIEHSTEPYQLGYPYLFGQPSYKTHSILVMKMRIRIIDIRAENPRIVLQEVISNSYAVPEDPDSISDQMSRSECGFVTCCYKLAYQKLMRNFVCRVEQVILGEYR